MSFKILSRSRISGRSVFMKDDLVISGSSIIDHDGTSDADFSLCCLYRQLASLLESKATDRKVVKQGLAEDGSYAPRFWISKWAKSSQKSGFCYELCDRSVGILFDDRTQFIMDSGGQQALYYSENNSPCRFHSDHWPEELRGKKSLFESFSKRRLEYVPPSIRDSTDLDLLPRLRLWRMTSSALIMQLTDGTVQVNHLSDHSKLVFSPMLSSLSIVDAKRDVRSYRFQLLEKHGCNKDLFHRVRHAKRVIELLILENDDCVRSLSQDGYEIRRCASLPTRLSDCSVSNSHENLVLSCLENCMKK